MKNHLFDIKFRSIFLIIYLLPAKFTQIPIKAQNKLEDN